MSSVQYLRVLECLRTCIARAMTPSTEQISEFTANGNREKEKYNTVPQMEPYLLWNSLYFSFSLFPLAVNSLICSVDGVIARAMHVRRHSRTRRYCTELNELIFAIYCNIYCDEKRSIAIYIVQVDDSYNIFTIYW